MCVCCVCVGECVSECVCVCLLKISICWSGGGGYKSRAICLMHSITMVHINLTFVLSINIRISSEDQLQEKLLDESDDDQR